jgi:hypothetical protein
MDVSDTPSIARTRKWPRLGLRGLLLSIAILTALTSHVWTSYRLYVVEEELHRLRREAGILRIDDPSRIYVLPANLQVQLAWRYKLHLLFWIVPEPTHDRL